MDLDAMTILLGDAIFNIKEEEYCEACQHALKNPYEVRTNDENDERGEALNDYDKGSGSEDNNSDDSKVNDSDDSEDSDGGDNNNDDNDNEGSNRDDYGSRDSDNDKGEPSSDREDEDVGTFYEDNSYDDVGYYDEDIEDDVEAVGGDYNEYLYGRTSDWSCITGVNPKSGS
ncbi:hypothetical protein RGQ29_027521 [Quercus rubra]|uniref:Uncharacterized protein n=1 Tax=Quercus rubra TaxID=3512 RepID=A0AAN7ILF6_QUERU|nr:hypothetical protein RGQ29_027521 [Quercus rubra]